MRSSILLSTTLICDAFNVSHWEIIKYSDPQKAITAITISFVLFFVMDVIEVIKK